MVKSVKYLVVDSGAFIKNAPIAEIAENVYTIQDVVSEIRDKQTRQNLQVLPYDIHFKEPTPEAIKLVTEFSKKTGDYPSLSAVDIRLIALVYQLEKEHVGTEHIRTVPERNVSWVATKRSTEAPTVVAGFYLSKKPSDSKCSNTNEDESLASQVKQVSVRESDTGTNKGQEEETGETDKNQSDSETKNTSDEDYKQLEIEVVDKLDTADSSNTDLGECTRHLGDGDIVTDEQLEDDSENKECDTDDDDVDDDDGGGWITPSNIKNVLLSMKNKDVEKADVTVGCLTTDFAMQNVLIQMRLNVVSFDGMLIKKARSYVLRCYSCFKITTNMTKVFCYHCGNKTLQKTAVTVDEGGNIHYYLSKRRPISIRGTKYSLPKPQGGKHARNPILVEDQPMPHQEMAKKSKIKYDVFDPDYVANASPFAPIDTTSRSAVLGIRKHGQNFRCKRNPNENRKVYGRRK